MASYFRLLKVPSTVGIFIRDRPTGMDGISGFAFDFRGDWKNFNHFSIGPP